MDSQKQFLMYYVESSFHLIILNSINCVCLIAPFSKASIGFILLEVEHYRFYYTYCYHDNQCRIIFAIPNALSLQYNAVYV